jgi:hypothetical protein
MVVTFAFVVGEDGFAGVEDLLVADLFVYRVFLRLTHIHLLRMPIPFLLLL